MVTSICKIDYVNLCIVGADALIGPQACVAAQASHDVQTSPPAVGEGLAPPARGNRRFSSAPGRMREQTLCRRAGQAPPLRNGRTFCLYTYISHAVRFRVDLGIDPYGAEGKSGIVGADALIGPQSCIPARSSHEAEMLPSVRRGRRPRRPARGIDAFSPRPGESVN